MALKPFDWSVATPMWAGSGYCDMPYMATVGDGTIISSLTVNARAEGAVGQHILILRSEDVGRTWSVCAQIEPADGPEASWGMPWFDPHTGRLHLFYVYNAENVRHIPNNDGSSGTDRADSVGMVAWRASDDGGRSWTARRLFPFGPLREIDKHNPFGGKHRLLWTTGHPVIHCGKLFLGLARLGAVEDGDMFRESQGFVWQIDLLALDTEQAALSVLELPSRSEGGLCMPNNPINEEVSPLVFEDGVINVIFRTGAGQLAEAWSTDGGATFQSDWARQASPNRAIIKQPRAPAKQFHLPDGRILLWHYNNDWKSFKLHRNPVWYRLGERDGPRVRWGDAYALCFDTSHECRIVYPSLLVVGNEILISAGDKQSARLMRFRMADL